MQIFINLIGNAIKFTPQNGRITVTAKKETMDGAAVALFSVADTGIGIPADQLDAVFESFRQVDGSHTRAHGGTGLGLAITKQLVTLHHGRIWATSTLGQGSQFVFFIPLEWTAVEPRTRRIDEDAKRVVVVDDNLIQLEVTRMILEGEGFAADLVADAQFAVERVRTLQPAFVILDVMMPQVSGVTVLRNLRADAETRDIPVLMATAYHSNRELVQEMGGIWLPKPWGAAELRKALSEQRGEK
jgi:CheY-like chemotaxis protein